MKTSPQRGVITASAFVVVTLLAGCGQSVSAPNAAAGAAGTSESGQAASGQVQATTITNCGRDLTFKAAPTRVVSLMPAQTELLAELGVADSLVGQAQTDVAELPAHAASAVKSVPVVSTDGPPQREALLAVGPDFVASPTEYEFTAEQGFASLEQLKAAGAQAYVATGGCLERRNSATVEDLLTDIDNFGAIFGATEQSTALRADVQSRLDAVRAKAGAEQPTVAQVFVEGSTLSVIGAGVEADIIKVAGGKNVYPSTDPMFANFFAATVTPEDLASRNPDAFVFAVSGEADKARTLAYLRATFPGVTAVKENRLIAISASDVFPGTLGNVRAAETVSQGLFATS